jgi:hypothetical protein
MIIELDDTDIDDDLLFPLELKREDRRKAIEDGKNGNVSESSTSNNSSINNSKSVIENLKERVFGKFTNSSNNIHAEIVASQQQQTVANNHNKKQHHQRTHTHTHIHEHTKIRHDSVTSASQPITPMTRVNSHHYPAHHPHHHHMHNHTTSSKHCVISPCNHQNRSNNTVPCDNEYMHNQHHQHPRRIRHSSTSSKHDPSSDEYHRSTSRTSSLFDDNSLSDEYSSRVSHTATTRDSASLSNTTDDIVMDHNQFHEEISIFDLEM